MTKLWLNPNSLSEAQVDYVNKYGQEKFDKLPWKFSNDNAWLSGKVEATDVVEQTTSGEKTSSGDSELLNLVKSLSEKVKQLEEKGENPFKKWKEKYEWPRTYSYKLWLWLPVLWYTSYKKDPSYGYTYTNQITWKIVSNHWMKLDLFDNWNIIQENVEVNHFNNNFGRSEKTTAQVISDGNSVKAFVFELNWKEFSVLPSVIN